MSPSDGLRGGPGADVCLVLEGTYPYVRGGVSTWVHELIGGLPELRFAVVHIGPGGGTRARRQYSPHANVVALTDLHCLEPPARGEDLSSLQWLARAERRRHEARRRPSRVLHGIRRLHLEDDPDGALLDDLARGELSAGEFLHGQASFDLMAELYERLAPDSSFVDFFWHFRSMHLPLVRLLAAEPPAAATYHAVCTGYAGILAAAWAHRTGRPLLLTEHGIYVRERRLELDRAAWLGRTRDRRRPLGMNGAGDSPTSSALRGMWARYFRGLARCAYDRASKVISLCEAGRSRQIADGAARERTLVVPNGLDLERFHARLREAPSRPAAGRRVTVGFVGRIVPIKDLVTLIRACSLALRVVNLDVRIYGPEEEDRAYARRCRRLVSRLGLDHAIRFEPARPVERIYPELDLLVLTSLSEGQPLVILEAGAAGIPVVASEVGACRELLEGRTIEDRALGPSGIVTRIAAPEETAAAISRLARDPDLRRRMGATGQRRVATYYQQGHVISAYRTLYEEAAWQVSAGVSSA